ncbi:DMT family transporter [Pseudoroseicyclus aestuarii]|uniref:S-adenosylmethionine uptake transporter n=1 Tax=Pseudoroseicyclus aestuarii TaxID=1795041 RepID=A0A318SXI5_9RHOB|nr:DMT family transporter [Pseudoroseicyclus aestuarii]PYE84537.1 S-adenosylmethionine uptake transporter [Pseudoroseicyclus aestuarii]
MGGNAKGAVIGLIAFAIFASHDAIVKTMGGIYAPMQLIFFSVTLSFPLAMLMIIQDPQPGTLRPRHPGWVAVRTGSAVLTGLFGFYAFSVLPLAQVYALVFATPLIITVLSIPILGETVRLRRWLAVIAGLIGVIVVLRPGSTPFTLGHLAAVGAAVTGSFTAIVIRKIGAEERPVVLLLYPMIGNFVLMACFLPFVYKPMPVEHLGIFAAMSVLGWIGGRLIVAAYSVGEAVIVAPMQYSQIIWATLFGALFFGEYPDWGTAIGTLIIIASGLYIVLRESGSDASAHKPVLNTKLLRPNIGTGPRPSTIARLMPRRRDGRA